MLDKNAFAILKVLNKLADADYKVITVDEIISAQNTKNQQDASSIKQIIDFLSKQDYINIKFSEDNTYCYSILPKAKQLLEQGTTKKQHNKTPALNYIIIAISAFVGTMLALFIFYCI